MANDGNTFGVMVARLRQGLIPFLRVNNRCTRLHPWQRGTLTVHYGDGEDSDGNDDGEVRKYCLQLDEETESYIIDEAELAVDLFELGVSTPAKKVAC